ncbi:ABC transporter permease [Rhodoplanes roseus]|uniref:ABC transporter permease n=1 Tax=Rhodoplanes roseus TaxID=29409 RepID=A0A327KLN9_9BRAD|nr:ABC transporter permease [Rhodoplanes roseus]RAI38385.1 ABC transporter permease [Rhodoplanes roseus]
MTSPSIETSAAIDTSPSITDTRGRPATRAGWFRLAAERIAVVAAAIAVWELAARTVIDPFWISSPSLVGVRLWQLAVSGDLLWHAQATVWQALLGSALGLVCGVAIGALLARYSRVAAAVDPILMGLYSLPRIALAPLFIIWFGIGLLSKVMMVFSFVVFIFLLNTMQGLRAVDPDLVDLMRSMRATPAFIARRVQLPSILPWLVTAARISVGLALIGSVLGELLGANRGLGWYVEHASGRLDTTGVFAGLVALMVIAVALNTLVDLAERWLVPARP